VPKKWRGNRIRPFRFPPELDARLQELVERTGSTASEIVRRALIEYLDRHKPDKKAKK
jgi:Predicted transcriptional regulator